MGTVTAYDSVDVNTVPGGARFLMGYNSGNWPTFEPMRARFPKAQVLSIAVQADVDGHCLDVEPGDSAPGLAPAWVERQLARGVKRPCVYTSVSGMPELLGLLEGAGISRSEVRLWTADYNGQPHICGPGRCADADKFGLHTVADATQWTDRALGRNLDQSLCQAEFWDVKTGPSPHYDWYETHIELDKKVYDERAIVRRYDALRDHSLRRILVHRAELAVLRDQCDLLAGRVARVALYNPKTGKKRAKAQWGVNHHGFRYQGLIHRAHGRRVA